MLISALSLELMDEAYRRGGFDSTALGFVCGAAVFTAANVLLSKHGAKHRKRSGRQQHSESEKEGSGLAIALGSLLDGIPEATAIGIRLFEFPIPPRYNRGLVYAIKCSLNMAQIR